MPMPVDQARTCCGLGRLTCPLHPCATHWLAVQNVGRRTGRRVATLGDVDYGTLSLALVVLIGVTWVGTAAVQRQVARIERRLDRTERKLDAVLDHLGVTLAEPELPEVRAYLREGKKIEAIKAYRQQTGAGLAEAKDAVERLAGQG